MTPPKINISAIMKSKNEAPKKPAEEVKDEINENTPIQKDSEKIIEEQKEDSKSSSKTSHISLWSIRTNKSEYEKKEDKEDAKEEKHENLKEELSETLWDVIEEEKIVKPKKDILTRKKTIEKNTKEVEKVEKESIEKIEKEIDKKVEQETKKKFNIKELEEDEKEKELFGNYKSDFKWEEVIKEVKEKRNKILIRIKEAKWKKLLVLILLILTIWTVWSLFIFDSENHNINKYKDVIASNYMNLKWKFIDKPWVEDSISVQEFSFDIFTQEKYFNDSVNYKYKEIVYVEKKDLTSVLQKEAKTLRQIENKRKQEEARLEAERLEKERLENERLEKEKEMEIEKEKIKNVLKEKYNLK